MADKNSHWNAIAGAAAALGNMKESLDSAARDRQELLSILQPFAELFAELPQQAQDEAVKNCVSQYEHINTYTAARQSPVDGAPRVRGSRLPTTQESG